MARATKKKKELTIEEKLAEALVPESEQPYLVPENWCWCTVGALCSFIGGGTPSKSIPQYWNGNIPWASVKDIKGDYLFETADYITEEGYEHSATNMCDKGDLLLVTRIEPAKTIISKIAVAINQDLKIVKSPLPVLFLHYYFKTFRHEFEVKSSGSTVKGITIPNVEHTSIPLPPLPEQQRIVTRIESLFAKLDEAKEKARAVVDGFEDRKAAILHKAFTGELTKEWRKERNVSISTWEQASIEKLCNVFSGKGFKEKEYSKNGVKLLRISNVTYNALTWEDTKFLPESYITEVPDLVLQTDDIVMALNRPITNGKLKVSLISDDEQYILYQRVGCLRIKDKEFVVTKYLLYFLLSRNFLHQVEQNLQGSDQPYINLPPLKKLIVNICSFQEQSSIVDILDKTLWCEQQAKEAAEQVISQIDTMKKSILARAFRGELGTNDPADESAVELLKRIL